MASCVSCGRDLEAGASFCPSCGATQPHRTPDTDPEPARDIEELATDDQEAFRRTYAYVAQELADGKNPDDVISELVSSGWGRDAAEQLVDMAQTEVQQYAENSAESEEVRSELARRYQRNMAFGALWMIGGTVVTVWTTASGDGRSVIAWGAIIFGAISFFRGLAGWLKYRVSA